MAKKSKSAKNKQNQVIVKSAPASVGTMVVGSKKKPSLTVSADGTTTIKHTEYVADVFGNNQDPLTTLTAVNPQRTGTFPWLSAIASRFEMYKFDKLIFHYKPSSSTNTQGYVVLAFDFDYYDSVPTKGEMLTWKYSAKSAVWQSCTLNVSQDSRTTVWKYADYSSRGDARLDMLGNLVISALAGTDNGSSSTLNLGELYVDYVVKFKQPSYKLPSTLFGSAIYAAPGGYKFVPTTKIGQPLDSGNIVSSWLNETTLQIFDAGRFLLQVGQSAATSLTALVDVVVNPIFNAQSSDWTFTAAESALSDTNSVRTYVLEILRGGVSLGFNVNNNTGINVLRLATYKG